MQAFVHQLHYAISANLTAVEAAMLAIIGLAVWFARKKVDWVPWAYTFFLILYITLIRRPPGNKESILLHFRLYLNLGIWVGNFLNILLYVPFGWAAERRKKNIKVTILTAACLSVFCEVMQYLTSRGKTDVNDILFNVIGAALGTGLARWVAG